MRLSWFDVFKPNLFMRLLLLLTITLALFSACTSAPDRLERALEFAGENKGELLKVLRYYEGDSLKYRAARFLIENMPHCYAYRQGGDILCAVAQASVEPYSFVRRLLRIPSALPHRR